MSVIISYDDMNIIFLSKGYIYLYIYMGNINCDYPRYIKRNN